MITVIIVIITLSHYVLGILFKVLNWSFSFYTLWLCITSQSSLFTLWILVTFYPFTVQLDLSYLFKFFKYHPSKLSMGKSPIIPNTYMLVLWKAKTIKYTVRFLNYVMLSKYKVIWKKWKTYSWEFFWGRPSRETGGTGGHSRSHSRQWLDDRCADS